MELDESTRKPSRTVTWSPFVEGMINKYTGAGKKFTTPSNMVESAMNHFIAHLEDEKLVNGS